MRTNLVQTCKTSANRINLNRTAMRVALIGLFISLGITNAWAGHGGTCTAKLEVKKGTGSGSVYAATTSSATSGNSSVSADCGNSDSGTHTHTFYAFATPAAGYTFLGWTESATSTAGADASNPKAVTITSNSHGTVTKTLYAHFVEKAQVNITFEAPSNGTYTIAVNGGSTETVSSANVVKNNVESVTLTATPASGYAFAGWYKLNSAGEFVEDLSIANPYNASFTTSETIKMGARFVPTTIGKFILKGSDTQYYGLKAATVAAGGSGTIVPVADETVVDGSDLMPFDNGSYILKAKLLIPYESGNTWQTLPKVVKSAATLSPYKKLILMDGVDIVVNSGAQICIGGQAMAGSGSASDGATGYTTGACGVLDMSRGGHLELNDGSTLYCWGFVKGQDMDQGNNTVGVGTITVNSGATVWEPFSVGDWRGGSATSSIVNTRFFPFQSYFMQNIEVPTTFWHGSSEWCYFTLNATGGPYDTQFAVIGSSNCLFKLTDAQSKVRTWYDPTTDLMCYELSGSAILDELKIKITGLPLIGTLDINSSQFDLPITSNMHLILADCTMNLTKPLIIQPGSVVEIKNNATVTLTNSIYLYDKDDWGPWVNGKYFKSRGNLTTHKNRGNGTSNEFLDDAKFIIDGSFTIGSSGKLYSTAGGANIMGNGGGTLAYPSSLSGSSTLKWYKSTTTSGDGETGTVAVNNANPCNEDESYTKAIASTTFYNVHGRWFKSGNQNEKANHTYDFTYISSGAVSGTGGTSSTTDALYAPDKTGLVAGMKWCNVVQDGTCSNIYNATQALNETPASDIRYTYPSSSWLQLLKTETEGVYGGSDNSLYAVEGCAVNSLGSVDENCLYTINDVKKALVDGHFVALEKNTEDEAWHDVANPTNYYICFEGCNWHPATKYADEEKAYIVEEGDYIWYNNDWLLVEREEPFFFDYNDQNVKRYYEYEDGAWVLASPRVRVVDAIETRDFYFWPEAFAIANSKKNATITLLKNVSSATSPLSFTAKNTTCTLDLNGHTVSLTITASGNSANLFAINAANSTFTITDNSANQDGVLDITTSLKVSSTSYHTRGIAIVDGALILNAGTVRLSNTYPYTSNSNSGMIKGINVAAGKSFTMNGGAVYAESPYYPRAINVEGSTSANATVNINNGTITAHSTTTTNAMGIYSIGGTLNVKPGVTINATTKTEAAYGIYVSASTDNYWCTLNMTGGTVNATATTKTAIGIFVSCAMVSKNTTPNTFGNTYSAVANISGGTINVSTLGTTTAYGIQTRGTTNVSGGTFNVTPKTTTAYGVYLQHGTTTISGTAKFVVKGTTTARGVTVADKPADKTGQPFNGNLVVDGGTFEVEATTGDAAYGVYVNADQRVITSTSSGYYPGTYTSVGTATINGGTFTVKAKKYTAVGVYVHRFAIYESGTNNGTIYRASATITGGDFTVRDYTHSTSSYACDGIRSYGTLDVSGGTFDVASSNTSTAKNGTYAYGINVYDGTATISGNPVVTVSAYGSAFGVVANGSTPDSKTGLPCQADLTVNGGTYNVSTTTSSTCYGVFVSGPAPRVITSTDDGYFPGVYYSAPKATIKSGTFNVEAYTTTAIGAYCQKGTYWNQETLEPHAMQYHQYGTLDIQDGEFNVTTSTSGTTTADGVRSFGNTTISGGTFYVKPQTNTSAGVRVYDGKTTISGSPEFTVKGTEKVYGVWAGCEAPNAKSGQLYNGEAEVNGGTFNLEATSKGTVYGVYAYGGATPITTTHASDANYFAGNYASAGKITVNDGTFKVKAKTNPAYGIVVTGVVSTTGNTNYDEASATPQAFINGGKYFVTATSSKNYAVSSTPLAANCQITGGYYNTHTTQTSGTYIDKYIVLPKKKITLRSTHPMYVDPNNYRYSVNEGGTVTWKNGSTTLKTEMYESGETPAYTGDVPTKAEDASYTYTPSGWDPAIAAMANADQTYTATFNHIEKKYTVNVAAGANGSASPASVSGIGCVTASGDITATANTGYRFANWTLPAGVTAADDYTSESNPIHIHATASGKTITANFEAKTYTVTLDNQSATTAGAANVTATYNEAMPSIAANLPAKTGYAFGGYYSEANGGGTKYYNTDGTSAHVWDIDAASPKLYAKWTSKTTTVTLDQQSGTGGTPSVTATYGSAMPSATMPTRTGYTFGGYFTETNGGGTQYYNANGSSANNWNIEDATKTLYAQWTCVSPTISSITSDENKWDFCAGEPMTLSVSGSNIAADAKYQWQKWNGSSWDNIAGETSDSYSTTMAYGKAGQYRCTVTNGSCTTQSDGVWVRVWQLHLGDDDIDFSDNNAIVSLTSDAHYEFKLKDNTGGWFGLNDKTVTRTESAFALNGTGNNVNITAGMTGNYTFTIDYSAPTAPTITIAYPTADQPANRNIYFDKSVVEGWGNDLYYRIGNETWHKNNTKAGGTAWTLVPGTDNFYTTKTMAFDGFAAWAISNNSAWCADEWDNHSIYGNATDGYKITKAIDFQKYAVGEDGVTIVPKAYHNTDGNSCDYWSVSKTEGMLTHTATITTPTNGTITIANTDQSLSETATKAGIPHRTILTITATPAPGYRCTSLTVDGVEFTSGSTHILSADAIIAATFEAADTGFWLDIVDVNNSAKTLTLNTNGWASSGWSYNVNDDTYEKGARQSDRTLVIPYTCNAGETFSITVKNKSNEVVSLHTYIIPTEIKGSANLGDQQMLFVKSGATLTVNTNKEVKNIYVDPDAKLVVNSGITLKADTVFLRTTPWASAELELDGTISGQVCYTRIIKKKDQYYQFGLPMDCPIANVRLSDGSTPTYGNGWLLRSYSESKRATQGSGSNIDNWTTLTNEGADANKTIHGGVGYEMFSNSGYYREYYFPIAHTGLSDRVAVTRTTDETVGASHEGWNIVVSPLLCTFNQDPAPEDLTVSWLQEDGSYQQLPVGEIKPAIPFSYQASETGYIIFDKSTVAMPAPRRQVKAADEDKRIQWIHLDVAEADGLTDQTSIYSHPTRYAETYQTGIDVAKQSLTASRAILYTTHAYGDMAFAGVSDSLLERGVALTVYSPKTQELTISMRENDWLNRMSAVWLIDHETGMSTDLLWNDYTFDALAGTMSGCFIIKGVFLAPGVATGLQNDGMMNDGMMKARKVIIDQKMYIQINGRLYDANGKLLKTEH